MSFPRININWLYCFLDFISLKNGATPHGFLGVSSVCSPGRLLRMNRGLTDGDSSVRSRTDGGVCVCCSRLSLGRSLISFLLAGQKWEIGNGLACAWAESLNPEMLKWQRAFPITAPLFQLATHKKARRISVMKY